MFGSDLMWFIAGIPGILIAMVVHEYSHARVAVAMGDMTPRLMGRLTLNPKAHIDPIGLLMLFIVHFGWAKPVMVNPRNFRDMRKGEILVALAGPASNLVVAFLTIVFMLLYARLGLPTTDGFFTVMDYLVIININFALFNILPLPPLDGSRVLMTLLPGRWAYEIMRLERYTFIILIALFVIGPFGKLLAMASLKIRWLMVHFMALFF
ncbi:site-2 protease family protein [Selenomonas sp.]|uniref:site-2 protease family protein n=1 Tax=Selenomonas sp. TaxID=2053611 RepID=UPI003FA1B634